MNQILIFLVFITLLCIFNYVIFNYMPLYMFIFEHKDWKLWRYFIKHSDEFKFERQSSLGDFIFFDKDKKYQVNVWANNTSTVFSLPQNDCILSSFYELQSKKLAEKLLNTIDCNNKKSSATTNDNEDLRLKHEYILP